MPTDTQPATHARTGSATRHTGDDFGPEIPWTRPGAGALTAAIAGEPAAAQEADLDDEPMPASTPPRLQALASVRQGIPRLRRIIADPDSSQRDYMDAMAMLEKLACI